MIYRDSREERYSGLATWVTIFFILIAPFENIVRIEKIYYVIVVLILGFCILQMKSLKRDYSILIPCYLIYAVISTVWSVNDNALSEMFTLVVVMIFLYFQLQFDYTYEDFEKIKSAFIAQGIILVVLCFLFGSYMDGRFWLQSQMSGADPNYLSGWFIIPSCFIFERLVNSEVRFVFKFLMCIEIGCFFYFIMESGSRSGLIVNVFVLIICVLYTIRNNIWSHPVRSVVLLLILAAVLVIGIRLMPETMMKRLINSNSDLGGRGAIWSQLWMTLKKNPIGMMFGMGSGSVTYYNFYKMAAHNTFFDIWFQYGIIGLGMFLYFLYCGIKQGYKNRPYTYIALSAMCILIFTLSAITTRFVMLSLFISGAQVFGESEVNSSYYEEG